MGVGLKVVHSQGFIADVAGSRLSHGQVKLLEVSDPTIRSLVSFMKRLRFYRILFH